MGRALRVGQLPLEGRGSTASRSATNRGAYLPFEFRLPHGPAQARRHQPPRDPRRRAPPADRLPARGPVARPACRPAAGGTTAASCARSTCGKINDVDFNTVVGPPEPRRAPPARRRSRYRVTLRNYGAQARSASPSRGALRQRSASTSARKTIGARRFATFTEQRHGSTSRTCGRPTSPNLYDAPLTAALGRQHVCSATRCSTGIRSIKVVDGHLFLNGRPLNFRGVACTRTPRRRASRSTTRDRDQQLAQVKELGATMIRTHYPLHPYTQELADELGIMHLVRDPGLLGQDEVPQAEARAPARGTRARARTSTPTTTTRR